MNQENGENLNSETGRQFEQLASHPEAQIDPVELAQKLYAKEGIGQRIILIEEIPGAPEELGPLTGKFGRITDGGMDQTGKFQVFITFPQSGLEIERVLARGENPTEDDFEQRTLTTDIETFVKVARRVKSYQTLEPGEGIYQVGLAGERVARPVEERVEEPVGVGAREPEPAPAPPEIPKVEDWQKEIEEFVGREIDFIESPPGRPRKGVLTKTEDGKFVIRTEDGKDIPVGQKRGTFIIETLRVRDAQERQRVEAEERRAAAEVREAAGAVPSGAGPGQPEGPPRPPGPTGPEQPPGPPEDEIERAKVEIIEIVSYFEELEKINREDRAAKAKLERLIDILAEQGWYIKAYPRLREAVIAFKIGRVLSIDQLGDKDVVVDIIDSEVRIRRKEEISEEERKGFLAIRKPTAEEEARETEPREEDWLVAQVRARVDAFLAQTGLDLSEQAKERVVAVLLADADIQIGRRTLREVIRYHQEQLSRAQAHLKQLEAKQENVRNQTRGFLGRIKSWFGFGAAAAAVGLLSTFYGPAIAKETSPNSFGPTPAPQVRVSAHSQRPAPSSNLGRERLVQAVDRAEREIARGERPSWQRAQTPERKNPVRQVANWQKMGYDEAIQVLQSRGTFGQFHSLQRLARDGLIDYIHLSPSGRQLGVRHRANPSTEARMSTVYLLSKERPAVSKSASQIGPKHESPVIGLEEGQFVKPETPPQSDQPERIEIEPTGE